MGCRHVITIEHGRDNLIPGIIVAVGLTFLLAALAAPAMAALGLVGAALASAVHVAGWVLAGTAALVAVKVSAGIYTQIRDKPIYDRMQSDIQEDIVREQQLRIAQHNVPHTLSKPLHDSTQQIYSVESKRLDRA